MTALAAPIAFIIFYVSLAFIATFPVSFALWDFSILLRVLLPWWTNEDIKITILRLIISFSSFILLAQGLRLYLKTLAETKETK